MFRWIGKRFGRRLAFTYVAVFTLVFAVTGFVVSRSLEDRTLSRLKETLGHQTELLAHIVTSRDVTLPDPADIHSRIVELGKNIPLRITLVDATGRVLGDSLRTLRELNEMDNHANRPEIKAALGGRAGSSVRYSVTLHRQMFYQALPLRIDGDVVGVLRTAIPLTQVEETLAAVRRPIILGSLVGIFCTLILGFFLSRYVTQRVRQMTEASRSFGKGDFGVRISVDAEDELGVLAGTMNRMASLLRGRMSEIEGERIKAGAILDNMVEGVIAVDRNRHVLMVNPNVERMFHQTQASIKERTLIELTKNIQLDNIMARAIDEHSINSEEVTVADEESRVLQANAVGVPCNDDQAVAGILVLHDITEIRKLEKMRREFVANVSHELKTPLTSIKGFIETLQTGSAVDAGSSRRFLGIMEEDANRLGRLIDDILDLSKIESGALPLKREALDIGSVVTEALSMLEHRLQLKKIKVENRIPEAPLPPVAADRDKLMQILDNLLDNALKFNREGGRIVLDASVHANYLQLAISDTGPGIPAEMIPRLFERFFRVDKGRSREMGGTGLGLAIVKNLVQLHGGTVACESKPGQGSTFTFTLPLAR
ncbi:MAG: ATP-binding protein [Candidatus Omnitrophota bacterium]|nr:ATP-binding protein [Candidatus Omnitrophota bacterium]